MAATKKIPVILLYGSLAALGMIAVTTITYLGGVDAFLGKGGTAYLMYVFPIALAIVAALADRRRKGGILGFRAALKACFGVIVLALAIQTIFTLILVKWIDPRFGRSLPAAVVAKMESTYRQHGVPEDEIARSVADQKGSDPFGFGPMLVGLARKYIVGFPVAVLFAAIIGQRMTNRGQKV
jgi:hypothetical protein